MDTLSLCLTIIVAVIGGTWVLRAGLGKIETAIAVHIAEDASKFNTLDGRVIKLERRRR